MNTNREIYTTYRGAVGIILHINRMFTMGKLESILLKLIDRKCLTIPKG
jgi:hypothetical protein